MVEDASRELDFKVAAAAAEELYRQLSKTERIFGTSVVINAQGRHEIRLRLSPTRPIARIFRGFNVVLDAPSPEPAKVD